MLAPNPAKFLFPAYFAYFHTVDSKVYVEFIVDHPGVQIKGPVSGFVDKNVNVIVDNEGRGALLKSKTLTLNTHPEAIGSFSQNEEGFSMSVRFSGQICHIFIPWESVVSVFCPDTAGLQFGIMYRDPKLNAVEREEVSAIPEPSQSESKTDKPRPKFGVIQGGKDNES